MSPEFFAMSYLSCDKPATSFLYHVSSSSSYILLYLEDPPFKQASVRNNRPTMSFICTTAFTCVGLVNDN